MSCTKIYKIMSRSAHVEIKELTQSDKDRFWKHVSITANPNICWNWQLYVRPNGYGAFKVSRQIYKAHRISYFLANNVQPASLKVCHKCDNPKCVNPNHLFLGTQDDNMKDAIAKGRYCVGSKRKGTKLTEETALKIREMYKGGKETHRSLAKIFSVSAPAIRCVLINRTWKVL